MINQQVTDCFYDFFVNCSVRFDEKLKSVFFFIESTLYKALECQKQIL